MTRHPHTLTPSFHLIHIFSLSPPPLHPLSDSVHSRSARIPSWHGCPSSETAVWRELGKIQSWKLRHRLGLQSHLCRNSTGAHSNSNVLDSCSMEGQGPRGILLHLKLTCLLIFLVLYIFLSHFKFIIFFPCMYLCINHIELVFSLCLYRFFSCESACKTIYGMCCFLYLNLHIELIECSLEGRGFATITAG